MVETDTGESATTNRRGKYNIKNVPEGIYTVTASKPDYVTQDVLGVMVNAGQTTAGVDFALEPVASP